MHKAALALPLLLAACAAGEPVASDPAGSACNADGGKQFVGQLASSEAGAAILSATNSQSLRWAPPGAMLTRDYRPDRVTVHLGPDQKITQLDCG